MSLNCKNKENDNALWEYDAPNEFIDFNNLDAEFEESTDTWFDMRNEDGPITRHSIARLSRSSKNGSQSNLASEIKQITGKPKNIVSSLKEWREKTQGTMRLPKRVLKPNTSSDAQPKSRSRSSSASTAPKPLSEQKIPSANLGLKNGTALKRSNSLKNFKDNAKQVLKETFKPQPPKKGLTSSSSLSHLRSVNTQQEKSTNDSTLKRSNSLRSLSKPSQNIGANNRVPQLKSSLNNLKASIKEKLSSNSKVIQSKEAETVTSKKLARSSSLKSLNKPVLNVNEKDKNHLRRNSSSSVSAHKRTDSSSTRLKITVPTTPNMLRRIKKQLGSSESAKSTEEKELDQIKVMREEANKLKKTSAKSLEAVKGSTPYNQVKSVEATTKPEAFKFQTDARLKNHPMETRQDLQNRGDFLSQLRKTQSSSQNKTARMPMTVTQPFSFDSKKSEPEGANDSKPFVSMAEKCMNFASKTPERFKSRPANKCSNQESTSAPKMTVPKTPNLTTRSRKRPNNVMSQSERENLEIEEMKRFKLMANPVNEKILKPSYRGVKKVAPKPTTVPEQFEFEIPHRKRDESKENIDDGEDHQFHASSIPKGLFDKPLGVKPADKLQLTHPQSPAFALKNRKHVLPAVTETEKVPQPEHRPRLKAHSGIIFAPKLDHKNTEIVEFSFQQRDEQARILKEQKIQQVYEEEKKARVFHARNLPDFETPAGLPEKHTKSKTSVKPFHLESDIRGSKKSAKHEEMVKNELEEQKNLTQFRANPADVIYRAPFAPKISDKILTQTAPIELSTESRAEQRHAWERQRDGRADELAVTRAQRDREARMREEAEVAQLRQETVHRARPVAHYRPVNVQPSSRPVTQPVTPRFSTRPTRRHANDSDSH